MRLINLIDNSGQLLNIILKSPNSADRTAEYFFRSKRKIIGSKERKFISQIVFASIRNLFLIENVCRSLELYRHLNYPNLFIKGKKYSIMVLVQILLAEYFHSDFDFIVLDDIKYVEKEKTLSVVESILVDLFAISKIDNDTDNIIYYVDKELSKNIITYYSEINKKYSEDNLYDLLENIYSFPKEFIHNLLTNSDFIDNSNVLDFAKSMNRPANTCIRVNTSITNVKEVVDILKEQNIESYSGKTSPSCIIISERKQLTSLDIYKQGYFTIQDEASQLVGYCIDPNSKDTILDACAGAGGKSLHLADLQNDSGTIIATDIKNTKLKEINKRAALGNFNSIISINNKKIITNNKKFDIVLVDAPCSGSGTIRRDPMKKYTISSKTINKIANKQLEILTNYSKYVTYGGVLVYSTCSIFQQENEHIIELFLKENTDFLPESIFIPLKKYEINISTIKENAHCVTLFPSIHNTDGFFIARMRRNG